MFTTGKQCNVGGYTSGKTQERGLISLFAWLAINPSAQKLFPLKVQRDEAKIISGVR